MVTYFIILLATTAAAVWGQPDELVQCFTDNDCFSETTPLPMTRRECCVDTPDGTAFRGVGIETCNICTVFGFFQSTFTAPEQHQDYSIPVGYLKRPQSDVIALAFTVNQELLGTATIGDSNLQTSQVVVLPTQIDQLVTFNFFVDGIALEMNETLRLRLTATESIINRFSRELNTSVFFLDTADLVIMDGDRLEIGFTENDYRVFEPTIILPIRVSKNHRIAIPVTVTVTPVTLTQYRASTGTSQLDQLNIIPDNHLSPIEADLQDFNTSVIVVTFQPDERGRQINAVDTPVSIVDDDVNEADEQNFVVTLDIVSATDLIISRKDALCRINDDDDISIGFQQPTYTFSEPDGAENINGVVLLKKENDVTSEQTFQIVVIVTEGTPRPDIDPATPATGVSENDYTTNGVVVFEFPPDQQTISFDFVLYGDDIPERTEAFQATLCPQENSPAFLEPTMLTPHTFIVIEDNDVEVLVIGFERNHTVVESAGFVAICTVVTFPSRNFEILSVIFLGVNTMEGTADERDYAVIADSDPQRLVLRFDNIFRVNCFQFRIFDDGLTEDTESLTIDLVYSSVFPPPPGVTVVLRPNVTTVEIVEVVIGFIDPPYQVNENDGSVNLTIGVLTGKLQREVVLSLSTSNGTAFFGFTGSDFEGFDGTLLTFGPIVTRANASVHINNDNDFEVTKYFSAILTQPDGPINRVKVKPVKATVTILDDDVLMFEFIQDHYIVNEDEGSVVLNVHFVFGIIEAYNISVVVSTTDGSAVGGISAGSFEADFISLHMSPLEFTNVERMASTGVIIADDGLTENKEYFSVQLVDMVLRLGDERLLLSNQEKVRIMLDETNITIMDNDRAVIGFLEPIQFSVGESNGSATFRIGVRTGELGIDVPVTFTTVSDRNGTTLTNATGIALADEDFTFETHNLSLTGTKIFTVSVAIHDDNEVEGQESFLGVLSAIGTLSSRVTLFPAVSAVYIIDDDAVIGFKEIGYSVNEGEGIVRFRVQVRSGTPSKDVAVLFHTEDRTAKAPNDYVPINQINPRRLTFLQCASASEIEVAIPITQDDLLEHNEMFIGVLRHDDGSDVIRQVRLEPAEVTVHIINDDSTVIGFVHDSNTYEVSEGTNRFVDITVRVLEGQLERDVVVQFDTVNGTAAGGVDYMAVVDKLLTFNGRTTSHVVSVSIIDDKIDEAQETFNVSLELVNSAGDDIGVTIAPNLVQIHINNTRSSLKVPPRIRIREKVKPNHMLKYSVGMGNNFCLENATEEVNFTIRCDSVQARVQPSVQWFYDDGDSMKEIGNLNNGSNIVRIEDSSFDSQSGEFSSMLRFGPASLREISELFNPTSENISLVFTCTLTNDFGNDTLSIQISECAPEACQDGVTNNCTDVCSRGTDGVHVCNCSEGFSLEADNATCTVIDCGELTVPVNGTVTYSPDSTTYNSTANYTCNSGYVLRPLEWQTRICQASGQWSGSDADCVECREGYTGDGMDCNDIDECQENRHNCISPAQCINTDGTFVCTCPSGYELNSGDSDERTCTVHRGILAGVTVVGLILLLIFIIVTVLTCRKYCTNKKIKAIQRQEKMEMENLYVGGKATGLSQFTVQSSSEVVKDIHKALLIYSSNLRIQETIGQGEFGVVYKGHILKDLGRTVVGVVAVKTLKGFFDELLVDDLLKECLKMQQFDHPNVLKLTGVCMDGGPTPFLVMPFMANGSLYSYLKKERRNLVISPDKDCAENEEAKGVALKRLLDMCLQVARGMEYLASKRVIHRDLAARNCMIDMNFVIKVADFGLAEQLETKDYFRQDKGGAVKLPIKWLALESLVDSIFSEKTDVWAYGVTCWEIFSGGKAPYASVNPSELSHMLESGYRMEKPTNVACSDEVYSAILQCWNGDPAGRPTFSELVERLSLYLESMAGYLHIGAFGNNESQTYPCEEKSSSDPLDLSEETDMVTSAQLFDDEAEVVEEDKRFTMTAV